jgi:hypothetical protein
MEQLCDPIKINRKFVKMIENEIKPEYDKLLNEIYSKIIEELNSINKDKILKKDIY